MVKKWQRNTFPPRGSAKKQWDSSSLSPKFSIFHSQLWSSRKSFWPDLLLPYPGSDPSFWHLHTSSFEKSCYVYTCVYMCIHMYWLVSYLSVSLDCTFLKGKRWPYISCSPMEAHACSTLHLASTQHVLADYTNEVSTKYRLKGISTSKSSPS